MLDQETAPPLEDLWEPHADSVARVLSEIFGAEQEDDETTEVQSDG